MQTLNFFPFIITHTEDELLDLVVKERQRLSRIVQDGYEKYVCL